MIIFLFLIIPVDKIFAQKKKFLRFAGDYHLGAEVSVGLRMFSINSNLPELKNTDIFQEGAAIGVNFGAKSVVIKARQSFYYAVPSSKYSIDELRSSLIANYFPLSRLGEHEDLRFYFLAGIEKSNTKFFGYYTEDSPLENQSVTKAPFLGKISGVHMSIGAGLEYKMVGNDHYVAIFGDVRYSRALSETSSSYLLSQTKLANEFIITLGVSLGFHR